MAARAYEHISPKSFHPSGTFVEFKNEEIEQSVVARFEKVVRRFPARVAVKAGNHTVTYSKLNTMANKIAYALVNELGYETQPVGLLLEKGIDQVAAMLGIFKAGKILVLLDSQLPSQRIARALSDSQSKRVVCDHKNFTLAREAAGANCQLIDFHKIKLTPDANDLLLEIRPSAFACIIYTSGSTGRPKGVIQNHRNLLHTTMVRTNHSGICQEDKVADLTVGTANSIFDVLFVLLNGAVLLPYNVRTMGVYRLAAWLSDEKISVCAMSSRLFRAVCHSMTGAEKFPDLRFIRLRSEPAYKSDVDLYRRIFSPNSILCHGLSSTETGYLRLYVINHDTAVPSNEVPVGFACVDKDIKLLDDNGQDVGFNKTGEIVVRSKYLSPGYWNNPELTAAKFKPDPYDSEMRLYLTGDLGVMLSDGCLMHKGRKDFRIKIRGYGVDLVEIEIALLSHPAIREAVIVPRLNELGESYLVGYFVFNSGNRPTISEIRRHLGERLADYMIPSVFVRLDVIPLTSNGKVDRKALPAPDWSRPHLDAAFVAPRSQTEQRLAEIWADILSLDRVGIDDNFFELGGHSLAASRVVSQVIKHFRLEIPLQSLFSCPTVAEMAKLITEHQGKQPAEEKLQIILAELESLTDEEAERLLAISHRSDS